MSINQPLIQDQTAWAGAGEMQPGLLLPDDAHALHAAGEMQPGLLLPDDAHALHAGAQELVGTS